MRHPGIVRRSLTVFLLTFLIVVSVVLASPPPQQPSGGAAGTSLVLVPVVVTDKSGQHVGGLAAADFAVVDDDKPQKLAFVDEIKQVPPTIRHLQQPGMHTNMIEQPQAVRGMTIIMIDQVNTPFLAQSAARQAVLKYLATHLDTNQPVALYLVGKSGIRVLHDFTADPHVLIAAIKKIVGGPDMALSADDNRAAAAAPDVMTADSDALGLFFNTNDGYANYSTNQSVPATLQALRHVGHAVEGIPGRKSLLWVTGAFPFEITAAGQPAPLAYCGTTAPRPAEPEGPTTGIAAGTGLPDLSAGRPAAPAVGDAIFAAIHPYWERTAQAMSAANLSIYPVDARALLAASPAPPPAASLQGGCGSDAQRHATMAAFAEITGGKAYYTAGDINTALAQASGESGHYYLAGYYADSDKVRWHKLQVTVGKPGLDIRQRTGYMPAGTVVGKKPDDVSKSDISAAIASPLDYTSLPVRVFVDPAKPDSGGKKKVPFEVDLLPGVARVDRASKNRISLEFFVVAKNILGEDAQRFGQKYDMNLADDQLRQFAEKGLNYTQTLQLAPGSYQVHFIVRDDLGNRLGSVIAPVQVQ